MLLGLPLAGKRTSQGRCQVAEACHRSDCTSVVVDAAVDVGGIEVTEHFEGRGGLGFLGVALLEILQLPDLLLDLGGDCLLAFRLGLGEGGAIGLELVSDGGHGTQPQQGPDLSR